MASIRSGKDSLPALVMPNATLCMSPLTFQALNLFMETLNLGVKFIDQATLAEFIGDVVNDLVVLGEEFSGDPEPLELSCKEDLIYE